MKAIWGSVSTSYSKINVLFSLSTQDVNKLSMKCRVNVFVKKSIYVPESTRSCPDHLDVSGFIPNVLL